MGRFTVPTGLAMPPQIQIRKVSEADPAREIPKSNCGKAQEPTTDEWKQAAVWTLRLDASAISSSQARLAIRYRGDAARLYAGEVLLTDNWFTGYKGDGQMEVGLSYLAGEVPSLLSAAVNLTLHVLPLRKDTLGKIVF